jgi:hypothetical protein
MGLIANKYNAAQRASSGRGSSSERRRARRRSNYSRRHIVSDIRSYRRVPSDPNRCRCFRNIVFCRVFYVVFIAMPRAMQISIMGAALGVTADAGYARLNDQTPITIANALVKLADSMIKSVGLIAADAQVGGIAAVTPTFVWAFIISLIFFMGFSFLVDHDG